MKYNTKAITTIPAWANAMHEGYFGSKDEVANTATAYAYVPLIFRATRLICNSLVSVPIKIYKGDTEVDWPFPDTSLRSLIWKSEAALCLTGADFIEKMPRKLSKKTGGLMWVNPNTMNAPKLIRGDDGSIDYLFTQKNHPDVTWNLSTMIYIREFSLSDDVGPGVSSAGVAMGNSQLLHYMSRFAARFFETGAMPVTVLQIEGLVDPDEAARIEGFFKKTATRIKNAWNVLALNRTIEPKMVSQPLKDLVMPELADEARRAVADAYDMHPSLLDEAPNMATAQEHRLSLYQDSIEPRAMLLAEEFNRQLLKPMGLEMSFAFEELDIYQEDETQRAAALGQVVTAVTTDPAVASWAMDVLGYDLTDEQEAALQKLITEKEQQKEQARQDEQARLTQQAQAAQAQPVNGQAPKTPAPKPKYADDLTRWQRKALRVLGESGSAVCSFDSTEIPPDIKSAVETALSECNNPDDVRSVFAAQTVTVTPAPAYADGDLKALADAINRLAGVDAQTTMLTEVIKTMSRPKEEDMQVIINNPANVDVTSKETIKAIETMTAHFETLKETVAATPPPQVIVNVPEQAAPVIENKVTIAEPPAPVITVNVPEAPAPVVNNEITVQPADVTVKVPKVKKERQKVNRRSDGLISDTETTYDYDKGE